MIMLKIPINATLGFISMIKLGVRASKFRGEPCGCNPNSMGNCFAMIIIPIAASNPCIAAFGKNSVRDPIRSTPNTIWITPAPTPTPNAKRYA